MDHYHRVPTRRPTRGVRSEQTSNPRFCTKRSCFRTIGPALLALSLLVGFVAAAGAQSHRAAGAAPAAVIPDNGGPLEQIVLHYDPYWTEYIAGTYEGLFNVLGPDVRILVLCPTEEACGTFYTDWGARAGARGRTLQVISVGRPITLWARDRCIARIDVRTGLPAPSLIPASLSEYTYDKRNELLLPNLIARRGGRPGAVRCALHLEGGNVVANSSRAFVGANVVAENADWCPDPARLESLLRENLGRPVVMVSDGSGRVPWSHLDMYLTPIDDRTVLVASSEDVLCLLAGRDTCDPLLASGNALWMEAALTQHNSEILEAVADRLEAAGYRVVRMPAVLDPAEEWMVTYNNVLMERRGGRRIVYMPTYDIPLLDEEAERVYRRLGFTVQRVDVSGVYSCGGALRCMVNVASRGGWRPVPMRSTAPDNGTPTAEVHPLSTGRLP